MFTINREEIIVISNIHSYNIQNKLVFDFTFKCETRNKLEDNIANKKKRFFKSVKIFILKKYYCPNKFLFVIEFIGFDL